MPDPLHHAVADRSAAILAREPEALLDLGMQPVEIAAEGSLINGAHLAGGSLRQFRALGRS
jgi:hypothetical protein